jgi:hypothetical protein
MTNPDHDGPKLLYIYILAWSQTYRSPTMEFRVQSNVWPKAKRWKKFRPFILLESGKCL